ncbi:MAG: ACT domain-containing protein [bacterium]
MTAISDLAVLLADMEPVLHDGEYGYACVAAVPAGMRPFAVVAEAEGLTLVAPVAALAGIPHQGGWARISLTVVSDLAAVGLTAAVAAALSEAGISANVIAGYHHDHFFVQAARADDAMAALLALTGQS